MKTRSMDKLRKRLNEEYREEFKKAMANKFNIQVTVEYSIFSMSLISERCDGKRFTKEQKQYADGYSDGFARAMGLL